MNEYGTLFAEVGAGCCCKHGQNVCGDVFDFHKMPEENRVAAALSDGLGSGIKANILAKMTVTMALKFMQAKMPIVVSAETMMGALPCCRERDLSYATFTLADIDLGGKVRLVEYGNPEFMLFRANGTEAVIATSQVECAGRMVKISEFTPCRGDRLLFFSDGISQAGLGSEELRSGWLPEVKQYVHEVINAEPELPAKRLAELVVGEALRQEPHYRAGDDMTCAAVHFRNPRRLMLLTGPPYDESKDQVLATLLNAFAGTKVICGGTTAHLVARELGRQLRTMICRTGDALPPASTLEGMDLVTEGIYTLTQAARYLEDGISQSRDNAASRLVKLLLEHDEISFHVGTRINQAHQDPNLPIELEIRRNIVKRITASLQSKYYKTVTIEYH